MPCLLVLVGVACGGEPEVATEPVIDTCPPAPLRFPVDPKAVDEIVGTCTYSAPIGLGTDNVDFCSFMSCRSENGEFICSQTGAACSPHVIHECAEGAGEGVPCAWPGNGECAVPGAGADLPSGIINGSVCACDEPGRIWRCLLVDSTSLG